ncbi:glycerol-3-phosphate dehydrogenase/oxidase [Meiothermus ruber]|jgi:glycerol-3-phosphate dehydrogenase|uniref:Glycerol-3-phosphate dehydrogenase n=1 Tax=Meiothermus ruber (strain ATCC 35948 / DSM 1279 / VKM B-1258 / 21) TaxID=504728 RepID=D3PPM3_MEIRD|nr:FAD-dependent oxidoreductase [Meiothermus ruber]ADD29637.1 Glycerol-3-phosphate dehydrogenase [Meiothermus ruber DSM 1279]AGK04910.1 glycerol-3-phosphate dehydrogenase [Meiothermus ruber DSM 1279]MCL6530410.1 FAD-dependent oxidoreductase [Meiothermus ruber]GAO76551.1 glycerol-3-phosphate dehydrogenase [Meiothermus ruber H328]
MERTQLLEKLASETFDLLVIGGGATGAGVALEAASRGLKTALVERYDFAEGTSSRSTKLIHGGVRYLELAIKTFDKVQLNLVRDALHERAIMLRNAPHLARPLWLLTPLYRVWEVPYYYTGLKLYDLLAGRARLQPAQYISAKGTLERFPLVNPEGLKGSVAYQDGQFDDARFNVELALTAVQQGAVVLNHLEVTGLLKQNGRLSGAAVKDRLSAKEIQVSARVIVNATGPFSDHIRRLDDPEAPPLLKASSGIHIVLDRKYSPSDTGLLIPKTEDGRVVFVLPWLGGTLVGTTDDPATVVDHPRVTEEEIGYVLRQVRPYLGDIPREAVRASWSGLRPLIARPEADTARLARDHLIQESASGLLTLTGGKWTTYRKMALDLVNYAVKKFGLAAGESRTEQTPLVGGQGFSADGAKKLEQMGFSQDVAEHLHRAYGARAQAVAQLAAEGYGNRLAVAWPYLEAEVIYAVRHEMACTPLDVLARRTRLAFLDTSAALGAVPRVVELMGRELGWNPDKAALELANAKSRILEAI